MTQDTSFEKKMMDRIKKCLARANHPNTPEREAQAAWRMSSRLMEQHNVTQADLIEKARLEDDYIALGGQSSVSITRVKDDGARITNQTWVSDIVDAMTTLFDCKAYSSARATSFEWTFYGIAANTVAAALALEMAHNLTLEWSRSKEGKNSYRLGIGAGLYSIARKEKESEKRRVEEADLYRDNLERDAGGYEAGEDHSGMGKRDPNTPMKSLMAGPPSSPFGVSEPELAPTCEDDIIENRAAHQEDGGYISDDEEMEVEPTFKEEEEKPLDLDGDFEEQLRETMPVLPANPESLDNDDRRSELTRSSPWPDSQALVRFRQSAEKVADEYLKNVKNKKLKTARKAKRSIRDWESYKEGKEDAKEIDLKRRRIEDGKVGESHCFECGRDLLVGPALPEYPGLSARVVCQCMEQ